MDVKPWVTAHRSFHISAAETTQRPFVSLSLSPQIHRRFAQLSPQAALFGFGVAKCLFTAEGNVLGRRICAGSHSSIGAILPQDGILLPVYTLIS